MAAIIISIISTAIAVISLIFSFKSQNLQNRVNELDLKLKQYELDQKEKEMEPLANVEARVVEISKGKHRMKVWNSGNTVANNVTVFFEEDPQIIIFDKEKMPYEVLEPGKSFDLNLLFYMGSSRKFKITTTWEDDKGNEFSNTQMGDI